MNRSELQVLRKSLGLTQAELADHLDMSLKAYADIENGNSSLRQVHVFAIERIALKIAAERDEPMLAPEVVRREALKVVRAIEGEVDKRFAYIKRFEVISRAEPWSKGAGAVPSTGVMTTRDFVASQSR